MNTNTLTEHQLDQLFSFCARHYVRHYDVQVELVDHLANAIEEKMEKQPGISFEKALEEVYRGFGATGFAGIVDTRYRVLEKQCRRIRKKYFLSHLTWPKAARTGCVLVMLIVAGMRLPMNTRLYAGAVLLVCSIVWSAGVAIAVARKFRKLHRKLLLTQAGLNASVFGWIIQTQLIRLLIWSDDMSSWSAESVFVYYSAAVVVALTSFLYSEAHSAMCGDLYDRAVKEYPAVLSKKLM